MTADKALLQGTVDALTEILTPTQDQDVVFGAQNEAFRKSQVEALHAIKDTLALGDNIMHIVQPGGTGKTREGIALGYSMFKQKRKSLFVVPTQQALEDFVAKAKLLCPDMKIGAVYEGEKTIGDMTFITYASLLARLLGDEAKDEIEAFKRLELEQAMEPDAIIDEASQETPETVAAATAKPKAPAAPKLTINPKDFDMVVWDEAHMYLSKNGIKVRKQFEHAINVGMTATPRYYEGKEVTSEGMGFGRMVYELSVETAKSPERRELSDFENVLVNTDIATGIELDRPEQEESAQVSRALNRRDRNLVFADLYRKGEVTVTRNGATKTHKIAGEPTITFGAGIDHVHDIATAINDSLMPALKDDPVFRQTLIDKGINPDDPELVIAAPIHTGASKQHKGMSLDQRNALVDKYHKRKVLMLVSTSVLQQSFDSPITSVVMDGVPRQTFVGVGQAAMRALRPHPDKELAILINTEDADHETLTFTDCTMVRGSEQGIEFIKRDKTDKAEGEENTAEKPKKQAPEQARHMNVAKYRLTSGEKLIELVRRRASENPYYRGDFDSSSRHFTTMGYAKLNNYLGQIAKGNREIIGEFSAFIDEWVQRTRARIEGQVTAPLALTDHEVEPEKLYDAAVDALYNTIKNVREGNHSSWHRFSTVYQGNLRRNLETVVEHELESIEREGKRLSEDMALSIPQPVKDEKPTDDPGFNDALDEAMKSLAPREREVVRMRYFQDMTLDQVAEHYGITRERIRQIERRGVLKLSQPARSKHLEAWAPATLGERPLTLLLRQKRHEAEITYLDQVEELQKQITAQLEGRMVVRPTEPEEKFSIPEKSVLYLPLITLSSNGSIPNTLLESLEDGRLETMADHFATTKGVTPDQAAKFKETLEALKAKLDEFKEAADISPRRKVAARY